MKGKNFLRLANKRKEAVMKYGESRGWTWKDFYRHYKQPPWCHHTDALCATMGCWSLCGYGPETKKWWRTKCGSCDCK